MSEEVEEDDKGLLEEKIKRYEEIREVVIEELKKIQPVYIPYPVYYPASQPYYYDYVGYYEAW